MGAYTNIKGWIQIPPQRRADAVKIIEAYSQKGGDYSLQCDNAEWYNSGWVLQNEAINGALFVFYGGEVRTESIQFIKDQVKDISRLEYNDKDYDYMQSSNGLFHLDEDGTYGYPPKSWIVKNGEMKEYERESI